MRNTSWILLLLAAWACACTENTKPGQLEKSGTNVGPTFAFSTQALVSGDDPENRLCRVSLPEAVVINADPVNSNRRLFTLSNGPHKAFVVFGKMTASFMLEKKGNKVEVYTSDNYPECLSKKVDFSIGADGTTFRYSDRRYINFEIQLISLPNGTQIALEMAPGAGYGIEVRR